MQDDSLSNEWLVASDKEGDPVNSCVVFRNKEGIVVARIPFIDAVQALDQFRRERNESLREDPNELSRTI